MGGCHIIKIPVQTYLTGMALIVEADKVKRMFTLSISQVAPRKAFFAAAANRKIYFSLEIWPKIAFTGDVGVGRFAFWALPRLGECFLLLLHFLWDQSSGLIIIQYLLAISCKGKDIRSAFGVPQRGNDKQPDGLRSAFLKVWRKQFKFRWYLEFCSFVKKKIRNITRK